MEENIVRNTDEFESQIEGQMSLEDVVNPNDRLFAVHRIFARARKDMTLAEQKAFVYALSSLKFKEEAKTNYVYMDKKELARALGMESDPDHLSVNLFRALKDLPKHSYIDIALEDKDYFESGVIITRLAMFKNMIRIKFEPEYLKLFTGLSSNYITMWSSDIFQMTSNRTVRFYEELRALTYDKQGVNQHGWSTRKLKEMFNIPKDGKGSYMRQNGHFDRTSFERFVLISYIVRTAPSISNVLFKCFFTKLIVFNSCPKPSNAKYSHCTGIKTESDAVNAFNVTIPSDGGQSIITKSNSSLISSNAVFIRCSLDI